MSSISSRAPFTSVEAVEFCEEGVHDSSGGFGLNSVFRSVGYQFIQMEIANHVIVSPWNEGVQFVEENNPRC